MPSVKLSPLFNDEQLGDDGLPLVGGKLYWYLTGTTTLADTYTTAVGDVAQTNPIILNARGEPPSPIWLESGIEYTALLNDSLDNNVRPAINNISGVNDVTYPAYVGEWNEPSGSLAYLSPTVFTVVGSHLDTFDIGRRIKFTVSGGTGYATVYYSSLVPGGKTQVLLINDSIPLDAGLSYVAYSIISGDQKSIAGMAPIGAILPMSGSTIPLGWLLVQSAATNLSRTTYASLFAVCQELWGAGDGVTTFGMPYLEANEIFMQNSGTIGAHTDGVVKTHTHNVTSTKYSVFQTVQAGAGQATIWQGTGSETNTSTGVSGASAVNLPAGRGVNYIVRYI